MCFPYSLPCFRLAVRWAPARLASDPRSAGFLRPLGSVVRRGHRTESCGHAGTVVRRRSQCAGDRGDGGSGALPGRPGSGHERRDLRSAGSFGPRPRDVGTNDAGPVAFRVDAGPRSRRVRSGAGRSGCHDAGGHAGGDGHRNTGKRECRARVGQRFGACAGPAFGAAIARCRFTSRRRISRRSVLRCFVRGRGKGARRATARNTARPCDDADWLSAGVRRLNAADLLGIRGHEAPYLNCSCSRPVRD